MIKNMNVIHGSDPPPCGATDNTGLYSHNALQVLQ